MAMAVIASWPFRFTTDEMNVEIFCSLDCYLDYFEDGETRPSGLSRIVASAVSFDYTCTYCGKHRVSKKK